jgi:PAS domain S-box-containing protein
VLFRSLASIEVAVAQYDVNGRFVVANRRMAIRFPELVADLSPEWTEADHAQRIAQNTLEPGSAVLLRSVLDHPDEPIDLRCRDGRWLRRELRLAPDGVRTVLWTDVTDLKESARRAEHLVERRTRDLRQTQALMRAMLDVVPAMLNVKDVESRYVVMSAYQAAVYGTTPDGAVGKTAADLLGRSYGLYARDLDRQVIETGEPVPFFDESYADAQGRVRTWYTTKVPIKDDTGRVTHIVTFALDVTERKRMEQEVANGKILLEDVLDTMDQGIVMFDDRLEAVVHNRRLREMFDLPSENLPAILRTLAGADQARDRIVPVGFEHLSNSPHTDVWSFYRERPDGRVFEVRSALRPHKGLVTVFTDITTRKKAEDAVRESERRLRSMLEGSPIAAAISDANGRVLFCNRAYADIGQFSEAELRALDVRTLYRHDADRERVNRALRSVGHVRDEEIEFHHQRRGQVWCLVTIERVMFEGKRATLGWFYDVTERRRARDELAEKTAELERALGRLGERESLLREIIDNLDASLVVYDAQQRYVLSNRIFRSRFPYLPPDAGMAGWSFERLVRLAIEHRAISDPEAYVDPDKFIAKRVRQHGKAGDATFERRTEDQRWDLIKRRRTATGLTITLRVDITDRRRAEEALAEKTRELESALARLRERETLLHETIDNLDAALVVYDENERYILGNRLFHERFPYLPDEADLVGRSFEHVLRLAVMSGRMVDRLVRSDPERFLAEQVRSHRADGNRTFEQEMGEGRWDLVQRRRTESGRTITLRVDVSEHKKLEEELRDAKELAEAATRAKSAFLAAMSHEIRTPLNGVIANLELLELTTLDGEQAELATDSTQAARALLNIVGDILDFSKIEADRLELEHAEVEPAALLDELSSLLAAAARRRGLVFRARLHPDVPRRIRGDSHRLRQVMLNLVGNAIKFTTEGTVHVALRGRTDGDGAHRLVFEVHDSGVGFPPAEAERLFEPFAQADLTTTRRFGGTGLGLAISRRLVELMGGRIGGDGRPGEGASFWFELPIMVLEGPASPRADLAGLFVDLVAPAERYDALTAVLKRHGAAVIAPGGAADLAVRALATGRDRPNPPDGPANEPWLLLAPDPSMALRREAHQGGAQFVLDLDDPVLPAALALMAGRVATRAPVTAPVAGSLPDLRAAAAGRPILVVEDNAMNQTVTQRQLRKLGLACDIAENGRVGLRLLAEGDYAAVLADCAMPEMDGYEMTRRWREREAAASRRVPIIALTANVAPEDVARCRAAGMDDYLAKPVALPELARQLGHWLEGPGGPSRTQPVRAPPAPALPVPVPGAPIDLARLAVNMGGADLVELRDLLGVFLESQPPLYEALARHLAARNAPGLRSDAHAAKGAARNACALELADHLATIEAAAAIDDAGSEHWASIEEALARALAAFDGVRHFIRSMGDGQGET